MDRYRSAPVPGRQPFLEPVPVGPDDCACAICTAFSSEGATDSFEYAIMDLVAELLDHGWEPEDLLDEVDDAARYGPFAGEIVTLALVSHAGYWQGKAGFGDLATEVEELASGFHYLIGTTVTGWLGRWARDIDRSLAIDGVIDVLDILPMLPIDPWQSCAPQFGPGRVTRNWRAQRC